MFKVFLALVVVVVVTLIIKIAYEIGRNYKKKTK